MQKPFHTWTRLFRQLGWQPRKGNTPPIVKIKTRTLMVEQLAPRHLLTVDVLGSSSVAELDDGEVVQEAVIVSTEPSDDGQGAGNASGDGKATPPDSAEAQTEGPCDEVVLYVDTNGDGQLTVEDFEAIVVYVDAAKSVDLSTETSPATRAEDLAQASPEQWGTAARVRRPLKWKFSEHCTAR